MKVSVRVRVRYGTLGDMLTPEQVAQRHPATRQILRWFRSVHLPEHLQEVARPMEVAAHGYVNILPDGPELTTGLRKMLEAKDCMVRAAIEVDD